jgi:hypothetical protein
VKRSVVPPLCIAITALVIGVQSSRRSEKPQEPATVAPAPVAVCSDNDLALADGIEVGKNIGDFEVVRFRCEQPRVMDIELRRGATPFVLTVTEPGVMPHDPPRQTPEHHLFYSKRTPKNEPPTPEEIDKLLSLLAERVTIGEKKRASRK